MKNNSMLASTLWGILYAVSPLQGDWSIRFHILNELRLVVESIETLKGATVEPFGSFTSNLFTRWGDLDVSIELKTDSHVAALGKKKKQKLLIDVLKALRNKGGWRRIQFISRARVPIIKLDSQYEISCDICFSNLVGQMNSKLLFWINEIDERFRALVLLVKEWAKAHDINDPKSGTLNSLSLCLLVVFHLQTLEPAILPPIKEIYPGNMIEDVKGVTRDVAEKRIEDICALNIRRHKSDRSRLINQSSLAELFISFLSKFADICSRASQQCVNTYVGQLEDIANNTRWSAKSYGLIVEDPFELPADNTARSVGTNQLGRIAEAIQTTRGVLSKVHQNQAPLVSVLVRPQISHMVPRIPVIGSTSVQYVARTPAPRLVSSKIKISEQQNEAASGSVRPSTSEG